MIKATLVLQDGRKIPVFMRGRAYKAINNKLVKLNFWERLRALFFKR